MSNRIISDVVKSDCRRRPSDRNPQCRPLMTSGARSRGQSLDAR